MRDNFLHFAQPGVYPNFIRISCEICMSLGTGRVVHPDSKSGAEHEAIHLSKLQTRPMESP